MKRTAFAVIAASAVFFIPASWGKAAVSLEDRARGGDVEAQYLLAVNTFFGKDRPVNPVLAVYWFRKAANAGHAASQYNLARCLERGWGCDKSPAQAIHFYRMAMDKKLPEAALRYAELLYQGVPEEKGENGRFPGLKADPDRALQIMRETALNSRKGRIQLARYLFKDAPKHGAELRRRIATYANEADADPEILVLYSACLRSGIGGNIDISGGVALLRRAADAGNAEAMAQLAEIYAAGSGLPPDQKRSAELTRRAAKLGNQRALVNLGKMHLTGIEADYDPAAAVECFQRAAESGYPPANCALGDCFARGIGVEQNWQKAAESYRLAASGGDENGCLKLADCYASGQGVDKDETAAFYWYRRAVAAGSVAGMRKMAIALLDGRGVKQNRAAGFKLLQRAAAGGDRTAQFMLQRSVK